jgi:hypothetical protein
MNPAALSEPMRIVSRGIPTLAVTGVSLRAAIVQTAALTYLPALQ